MPDDSVVELRVHGVGGPTPADVLETVDPQPVDGAANELAGFYNREEPGPSGQEVEAFVWGGLTSKTAAQAAWWLLLPFSLVNLAGWMVRAKGDGPQGHEPRLSMVWWLRLLITLSGIALTVLYLLWAAVALVDVVAYQCGAQDECVNRSWLLPLRWLEGHPLWRIALGMFLLALMALGLLLTARLTHRRYEEFEPDSLRRAPAEESRGVWMRNDNLSHPGFWYNWLAWRKLFNVHALTMLFALGALAGYSISVAADLEDFTELGSWATARGWSIALAVVVFVAFVFILRPSKMLDTGPNTSFGKAWRWRTVAIAALSAGGYFAGWGLHQLSGAEGAPLEGGLGLMTSVGWFFIFGMVVMLLPALLLVAVNYWKHFRWARAFSLTPQVNDGFRWFPPAAAVITAIAITGAGFGAIVIRLTDFLDRGGETVTFGTDSSGNMSSAGLPVDIFLIGLVTGLIFLTIAVVRARFAKNYLEGVRKDYNMKSSQDESARGTAFVKRVARGRLVSQIGRNVDLMLFGLMVGVIISGAIVTVRLAVGHELTDVVQPLLGFGGDGEEITEGVRNTVAWAVLLYVFPGAVLLRSGARNRGTRRQVGKVWESITFFPRRFHPLGAPCYAERAVPMLREHIREGIACDKKIVIRAHSQGTVLSLAALAQLVGEDMEQVDLLAVKDKTDLTVEHAKTKEAPPAGDESADADVGATKAQIVQGKTYKARADEETEERKVGKEVVGDVSLITLGSPMSQLHAPFFPDYFSRELLKSIQDSLNGRWSNYYRETDYIGKTLFVDPDKDLDLHGRFPKEQTRPKPPDHSLDDPVERHKPLERHSRYHQDDTVKKAIVDYVKELRSGRRGP